MRRQLADEEAELYTKVDVRVWPKLRSSSRNVQVVKNRSNLEHPGPYRFFISSFFFELNHLNKQSLPIKSNHPNQIIFIFTSFCKENKFKQHQAFFLFLFHVSGDSWTAPRRICSVKRCAAAYAFSSVLMVGHRWG